MAFRNYRAALMATHGSVTPPWQQQHVAVPHTQVLTRAQESTMVRIALSRRV